VTTGAFPFAVGSANAATLTAAPQAARQFRLSLTEVAARWLGYLAAALLLGGLLFRVAIWRPAATSAAAPRFSRRWRAAMMMAVMLLGAAMTVGLLVQAGQVSGSEIVAPWSAAVNTVLLTTRYGAVWLARLAAVLLVAGLLLTPLLNSHPQWRLWAALPVAAVLAFTISLNSHAAAEPQPMWPVLADWIHLLAASAWAGGLAFLVIGLWTVRQELPAPLATQLAARLVPRFSALALTNVALLALTGVYAAVLRLGAWKALTDMLYGRTLLVKLAFMLAMIGLGALNLVIVRPRLRAAASQPNGNAPLVRRFQWIVSTEATLVVTLLLSVSVLTALPPARAAATLPQITTTAQADDVAARLTVEPGRVGVNTFTLQLTSGGQPVTQARAVSLRFTPGAVDVPPSTASLVAQANGDYQIQGAYLSLPGRWQVQAVVQREGYFDAFANFDLELSSAASRTLWNQIGAALLFLAALGCAAAVSGLTASRRQAVIAGVPLAAALIVCGIAAFTRPAAAEQAGQINPIPPDADSVAVGRQLYQDNCAPCHGVAGQGDGPVGLTLNPRPADLSLHAVPGVHTDGQLYEWITNGFPGSVMPAFRQTLTDDERWHLVNFIRTLAPR
jgi:copper transport protein